MFCTLLNKYRSLSINLLCFVSGLQRNWSTKRPGSKLEIASGVKICRLAPGENTVLVIVSKVVYPFTYGMGTRRERSKIMVFFFYIPVPNL